MSSLRVLINLPDGRLRVSNPSSRLLQEFMSYGLSEMEAVRLIAENWGGLPEFPNPIAVTDDMIVDKNTDAIPDDRTYRDAWVGLPNRVKVDIPKARVVHLSHIRSARAKAFVDLDNGIRTGEDAGEPTTLLRQRRKALRDLPQTFDLSGATTPKELKALWPTELDGYEPE